MKKTSTDKSILFVTYIMVGLFVGLMGYFGYFLQVQSETVINNSYNARLDSFSDRIIRGEILSNDGTVLAKTNVAEDGTEVREYPYGSLFAHVVGYSDQGKTGLESLANFYLLSSHMNLVEQAVNELSDVKNLGDQVVTTLDVGLQQAASDALGDRRGAVVVMEPDTGKILAMVSKPGFDPNQLSSQWESLISGDNTEAQLLNRAAQGVYPPGSTFKIVTLLEYIREHPDTWVLPLTVTAAMRPEITGFPVIMGMPTAISRFCRHLRIPAMALLQALVLPWISGRCRIPAENCCLIKIFQCLWHIARAPMPWDPGLQTGNGCRPLSARETPR